MRARRHSTLEQVVCNKALAALRKDVARAYESVGLTLTVSIIRHTHTAHWQFRFEGRVVLHYWPTNGKWWEPYSCAKGIEPDAMKILERAHEVKAGREEERRLMAELGQRFISNLKSQEASKP